MNCGIYLSREYLSELSAPHSLNLYKASARGVNSKNADGICDV